MRTSISGIYQIQNSISGTVYIGSAVDIPDRWRRHKRDLVNDRHQNRYLQRAWNKYGEDAFTFTVLEYCQKEQLTNREQYYLDACKDKYNIRQKADSNLGIKLSEETRQKISAVQKGRKQSEETVRLRVEKLKGHPPYINAIKACIARTGMKLRKHTEEMNKQKSERQKGKKREPFSEEWRRKIGEAGRGRIPTEEARNNMREAQRRRWARQKQEKITERNRENDGN